MFWRKEKRIGMTEAVKRTGVSAEVTMTLSRIYALEHMDMILCRNVFIYFNRELQEQILERFWGALNKGGFLIQGNMESMIGPAREKFEEFDREAKMHEMIELSERPTDKWVKKE